MATLKRELIGHNLPLVDAMVDRSQLRLFAKAIGLTDAIYLDPVAATTAGYRDIVAPPTFLFGLNLLARNETIPALELLGGELSKALHGVQDFTYHAAICAGDRIAFRDRIVNVYEKAGGRLELFETLSHASNQEGTHVADMRMTIVVRHG